MAIQAAVRWRILSLLTFVSLVRSIDALNFSVAAKQIMPEYDLTAVQMGVLYTAFTVGYGFFHLPGGWLADVVGPRLILTVAILWWSIFTGLTALAGELPLVGQLPVFSANTVPLHVRETEPESFAGAGERAGEGGRTGY